MQEPIEILGFAQDLLKKQRCPFCDHPFSLGDVMAQGNRRDKAGKSCYYYETNCSECSQPSMTIVTSRRMDSRGLAAAFSEENGKGPTPSEPDSDDEQTPNSPPAQSGITDAEVESAKKMLDGAKTFDDVLKGLGMSDETIEKYMREGGQQDEAGDDKGK